MRSAAGAAGVSLRRDEPVSRSSFDSRGLAHRMMIVYRVGPGCGLAPGVLLRRRGVPKTSIVPMFSRKFERRIYIATAILALSGLLGVSFGAYVLWPERREAGYEPAQPIPFSHRLHAGDLSVHCLYCHTGASQGAQAFVPPLSTCMGCHTEVQPKNPNGEMRPGIAALLTHVQKAEPIHWAKVHDLADFVYFDHSRHVAAKLACQECHGPVETMDYMRREHGMKMGWCLDCHKQKLPDDDPAAALGRSTRAPIHCTTCHR